MDRRKFIKTAAASSGLLYASGLSFGGTVTEPGEFTGTNLTAAELQKFLLSLTTPRENTVDRFIIGDPETKVKKIATCWMPYWQTCKDAVKSGINVMVCHEPTFYTHRDLDEKKYDYFAAPEFARTKYLELVEQKKKWLADNGLVIIRNHDTIDALAEHGIPFAFGEFLGFGEKDIVASRKYYNVYRTEKQPAKDLARNLAAKMKEINQPGVAFYGDPERMVSSVGIGTGCACDPMEFADLQPDLFVAIEDIVRTWIHTVYAQDSGHPLVVINHGTSEEMGMRSLNHLIRQKFPAVEAVHIAQGCSYKWISA